MIFNIENYVCFFDAFYTTNDFAIAFLRTLRAIAKAGESFGTSAQNRRYPGMPKIVPGSKNTFSSTNELAKDMSSTSDGNLAKM